MGQPTEPLKLDRAWTAADLIGETFRLISRHAVLFMTMTAVVVFPYVIVTDVLTGDTSGDDLTGRVVAGGAVTLLLGSLVVPAYVTALHVVAVLRLAEGERPTVSEALRAAARRALPALGATALYLLAVIGGLILLIVPGVILGVRLYFSAQAAVVDNLGPADALRRSNELVKGRWWQTLGRLLLSGIVFSLIGIPFGIAFATLDFGVVYVLADAVGQTIVLSLTALFGTLVFMDYRLDALPAEPEPTYGGFDPPRPAGPRMA
jgi:hypothetical protein